METMDMQNRIVDGLLSVVLSARMFPNIRYSDYSERAKSIAEALQSRVESLSDLVVKSSKGSNSIVLILDRKDDPVTPLLNQWNYQAMIHELLTINNHRVKLANMKEEIVINQLEDDFFKKNMYNNYGDLGNNLNELVDEFKRKNKSQSKVESIEDMQRFMEQFPEFKRYSGNVTKHVNIMGELKRINDEYRLFDVSEVE